ncbi:MAG TPA: FGGY family carbohydrate kinase [Cyclobacteriaceae bacterium]|nr:FGGY family carbohydrate kinase [Cyclobacteriaceae bacterium]
MKPVPVIAVFDIGKTNKKIVLFDDKYAMVREDAVQFTEITDEDGDRCENIMAVTEWIRKSIADLLRDQAITVKAVNVSAYGASFVNIGEDSQPVTPLYNYLKPFPEKLKNKFYSTYGGELKFSMETASPVLGNLNSGMQLYRLKQERPKVFKTISYCLHLPQYISQVITSKKYSDITSIGCHTNLWNFYTESYHTWVYREGIDRKMAPMLKSDEVSWCEPLQVPVGGGLHDSSAALIPYLKTIRDLFILVSTGTWCISLNPFNHTPLTEEELKKDCLCYLSYKGEPVKASRLFAGHDHEVQAKRIATHFNVSQEFYKAIDFDVEKVPTQDTNRQEHPSTTGVVGLGKSIFEKRDLQMFANATDAYYQLMTDIISLQKESIELVLRNSPVGKIFVDGGFSKNPLYMNMLARCFPDIEIYGAAIAQSTSLGAALAIHRHWNPTPVPENLITLRRCTV